tara:strand:+ start:564 stop:1196 length:633 start_codon:yes stop_codon:yes gene_type:complete
MAAEDSSPLPQTHIVAMTDDMIYDPQVITISPGDTVRWLNIGKMGHSVTAYENELPEEASYWASGELTSENEARNKYPLGDIAAGESYSHTFELEGEYGYFCIPHETIQMVGKVIVQEGGASLATSSSSNGETSDKFGSNLPGGSVGGAFAAVGILLTGISVLLVFASDLYSFIMGDPETGPKSARIAVFFAGSVGLLLLLFMIGTLILS